MRRRDFLKTPGYFVAVASLGGLNVKLAGCGDDGGGDGEGTFAFAQGVASGDPRPSSVVIWTRVERTGGTERDALPAGTDPIRVIAQVSDSDSFASLVLEEELVVTGDSDHTLRLVVTGLAPATRYFYRFQAGLDLSEVGRTQTAPAPDADVDVRFAWVSCQDYNAGLYGAYRELIAKDEALPADQRIQFVVHLGDFIYETVSSGFQTAIDDQFQPVELRYANGDARAVAALPSGGGQVGDETFARTVDDYRHLYKQFLQDPDLRAARARWPFVQTWDDHEFTNDSWQTQANYDSAMDLGEASQLRKVAANQAWFEYIPAQLSGAPGVDGVSQDASDFVPVTVQDAPYTAADIDAQYQVTEPNNLTALGSLTLYRSLRFGRHVELVITDQRSYRSDHAVPEELTVGNQLFFDPRNVLPVEMVNAFDAGMTANGGKPPAEVLMVPNPRTTTPPGTMLGPTQKEWWKQTMTGSDATWKIWGNEVPLMRFLIKNEPAGILLADRIMSADAWDGYNTERNELMQHLRDNAVSNVVVITGDIHAHFAGLVMDDHDAAEPQPVAAEFCAAGVASNSLFSFYEDATRGFPDALRNLITYDATALGGDTAFAENLNVILLHGTSAALAAIDTHDPAQILAAKDPAVNPHLVYADTNAQGFGVMTVTAAEVTAELVTIERPITDNGTTGPGIRRTATFIVPGDDVALTGPEIEGVKPFPFT